MLNACRADHTTVSGRHQQLSHETCELLTFGRYEGFAAGSAPSHRVHLWDAEITPEVFTGVTIKAFIPQESLEAWKAQNTADCCLVTRPRPCTLTFTI